MKYIVEIDSDKTILWYKEGTNILHREGGPAVEYANGSKEWWQNGKLHRLNGPAIEDANGDKEWYQNGKLHRLDGPAIEDVIGDKYWYYEGKEVSEKEHNKLSGKATSCDGKIVNIGGKNYKLQEV